MFGEGLYWAGCAFVLLLSQQKRFEALDFCSHIVKVYDVDPRDETVGGVVSHIIFVLPFRDSRIELTSDMVLHRNVRAVFL